MPGDLITRANVPNSLKAKVDELWEIVNEVIDVLEDIQSKFDDHTHSADGAQAGAYFTSPPRSDAGTVTAGTASAIATPPTRMSH